MRQLLQLLGWFAVGLLASLAPAGGAEMRIDLTDTENAWIKEHPVILFGYDPGWGRSAIAPRRASSPASTRIS